MGWAFCLAAVLAACSLGGDDEGATPASRRRAASSTTAAAPPPPAPPHGEIWFDPATTGQPYGSTVPGVLTFRGNPGRTFYGTGPVPRQPGRLWTFPEGGPMCGLSTVAGEETEWCGTGWTGQPAVFERDGRTLVAFGAYDHAVHLLDASTGDELSRFVTGDIIKGSVTIDPDGHPLLYTGSRDDNFRVLSFAGDELRELWRLPASAVSPVKWNNDWDGSALVLGDHLIEGGENSRLHVVDLGRATDANGTPSVEPRLVFHAAGWDDQLLRDLGDQNVSIEGSVAMAGTTVYFANSGGLVQGWDLLPLEQGGEPRRTFRFWAGDDADASVVVDEEGMLYVAVEWDRRTARAREVGQLLKLDPTRPDDPVVWSIDDQATDRAGFWATPAVVGDLVIAPTDGGRVLGIDRATGAIRWELSLPGPLWSSPVVVDGVLVQGDCDGVLHGFDVHDPAVPPVELWSVELTGCIESTPAVWKGVIYVGTRGGYVHAVADP